MKPPLVSPGLTDSLPSPSCSSLYRAPGHRNLYGYDYALFLERTDSCYNVNEPRKHYAE